MESPPLPSQTLVRYALLVARRAGHECVRGEHVTQSSFLIVVTLGSRHRWNRHGRGHGHDQDRSSNGTMSTRKRRSVR